MQREYAGVADFAIVYLEEAHPTDGWMYGQVTHFTKQAKTQSQRNTMAQVLANEVRKIDASTRIELFVDQMDNAASHAFGAIPERLVILTGGNVAFIGGAGPNDYSIQACREALNKLI